MDKMDKKTSSSKLASVSQEDGQASDTRRQILKGAAVVPLLITVASRPVLGAQCSPSAWVSGNLSDHGHEKDTCGGRSPGYWKTNQHDRWVPTGYHPGTQLSKFKRGMCNYQNDGTKFHQVFAGNRYGDKSIMKVLWLEGNEDQYQLGAHISAALLNAASIPDYGMSVDDVKEIYRQVEMNGYYQTSTGENMTPEAVVLFIQNTFGY